MRSIFKQIYTLGKINISLSIALTCFAGYSVYSQNLTSKGLLVTLGVFFLSAGASALNQLQEIQEDRIMTRTAQRPLPTKNLKLKEAFIIIALFLLAGTICLWTFNTYTVMWGWMGIVWYNLVYTPLKKRTAFAIIPGAIVGAIPPIVGWIAAGGSIDDVRLHFLAFFFFLGQIPHFWLLVLKYKDQYKKAGFPVITDVLNQKQIININLVWFLATFVSALFLPMFSVIDQPYIIWIITPTTLVMTIWVIRTSLMAKQNHPGKYHRQLFIYFNSFYLLVMILIYIDQI